MQAGTRVALVHDFLVDVRGAERVFLAVCDLFGEADLFTAVYDEEGTEGRFAHRTVHTSYLQRLRPSARTFRALLPLYPAAMESLDLRGYDLVISSSSAWAHGVIPDEDAVHVCYCHNPFRYAWNARLETLAARGPLGRAALGAVFRRWRQWDWIAAQRVDAYLANSHTTRKRVARYFGRDATVLHPPVDVERFTPAEPREATVLHPPVELERFRPVPVDRIASHYLVLAELMAHKRIDVAVRAFNKLRLPLVVVGNGPDARRLHRLAGPTVRFAGRVSDAEAARLLARSRALVVTATEEFGIAAVEAQAAGRPVIALHEGGVRETVIEGETGTFFDAPKPAALAEAVLAFDALAVDPAACVASARRFDTAHFRRGLRSAVEIALDGLGSRRAARRRSPRRPRGLVRPV
jgi:glycosyltransferase involved in cell wall biosynthesis